MPVRNVTEFSGAGRESVLKAPPAAFYSNALLKPYVFFDVVSGREQRQAGGGSLRNQARVLELCCLCTYGVYPPARQVLRSNQVCC